MFLIKLACFDPSLIFIQSLGSGRFFQIFGDFSEYLNLQLTYINEMGFGAKDDKKSELEIISLQKITTLM